MRANRFNQKIIGKQTEKFSALLKLHRPYHQRIGRLVWWVFNGSQTQFDGMEHFQLPPPPPLFLYCISCTTNVIRPNPKLVTDFAARPGFYAIEATVSKLHSFCLSYCRRIIELCSLFFRSHFFRVCLPFTFPALQSSALRQTRNCSPRPRIAICPLTLSHAQRQAATSTTIAPSLTHHTDDTKCFPLSPRSEGTGSIHVLTTEHRNEHNASHFSAYKNG